MAANLTWQSCQTCNSHLHSQFAQSCQQRISHEILFSALSLFNHVQYISVNGETPQTLIMKTTGLVKKSTIAAWFNRQLDGNQWSGENSLYLVSDHLLINWSALDTAGKENGGKQKSSDCFILLSFFLTHSGWHSFLHWVLTLQNSLRQYHDQRQKHIPKVLSLCLLFLFHVMIFCYIVFMASEISLSVTNFVIMRNQFLFLPFFGSFLFEFLSHRSV